MDESDVTSLTSQVPQEKEPEPTLEEVEKALKSVSTGKAAGYDGIPAEMLKLGGNSVTRAMHRLIQIVWSTGKWSVFVPLFKKGDPTVYANTVRYLWYHMLVR